MVALCDRVLLRGEGVGPVPRCDEPLREPIRSEPAVRVHRHVDERPLPVRGDGHTVGRPRRTVGRDPKFEVASGRIGTLRLDGHRHGPEAERIRDVVLGSRAGRSNGLGDPPVEREDGWRRPGERLADGLWVCVGSETGRARRGEHRELDDRGQCERRDDGPQCGQGGEREGDTADGDDEREPDAQRAFASVGLAPAYGGTHSNGVTHMSTLSLPDGAYVECLSTREEGAESPWWDAHIRTDAGPCAWCVRVPDAEAATATFADRGVAGDGPHAFARERPDGTRLEWDLVYLGEGGPGAVLPFCIADTTPREWRVGEPLTGTGLAGIDTVVVGVPDLGRAAERLRGAFDLPAPVRAESDRLGATVAQFPDTPVALAAPTEEGWLAERLDTVGASPCAYLFDGEAAWLDPEAVGGIRHLGLVADG